VLQGVIVNINIAYMMLILAVSHLLSFAAGGEAFNANRPKAARIYASGMAVLGAAVAIFFAVVIR
jgi:hypothetical protein